MVPHMQGYSFALNHNMICLLGSAKLVHKGVKEI